MNLWAMPCRATQDDQVIVKSSNKTWSTGGGNGNLLQYTCFKNPVNSSWGARGDPWESFNCKEIKPVDPKGNQPWIFNGRANAPWKLKLQKLWPPDGKNWLIRKDLDAGKDWGQKEKGTRENKIVGWHLQLDGHEFEQTLEDGEGQVNLKCCSPRGHKELDTT